MKTKNYLGKIVLLTCLSLAGFAGKAQTKVFATTFTTSSSPANVSNAVTSASQAADQNLATAATLNSNAGAAAGAGAFTSTINLKFTSNVPANTPVYIKIGTQDNLLPVLLGGAVGNLLSAVLNVTLTGSQQFTVSVRKDSGMAIQTLNSQTGGAFSSDAARIVVDGQGNYLVRLVPNAEYNTISITNRVSAVVGLGATRTLNVFDAYYINDAASCTTDKLTSFTGSGILNLVNQGVTNPKNAIDANQDNHSTLNLGVLAAGTSISQTVYFQGITNATDDYNVRLRMSQQILDLNILGAITLTAYNGTTVVGTPRTLAELLSLNLLTLQGGQIATVRFSPGGVTDRITLTLASLVNLNVIQNIDFFGITRVAALPTITVPGAIACPGTPTAITATTIAQGTELRWYSEPTGGTLLATVTPGAAFVTPAINENRTFYVASARVGCTEESLRVPAPVNVVTAVTSWNGTAWTNGMPNMEKLITVTGNYNPDTDIAGCNMTVSNNAVVIIPEGKDVTLNGFLNVQPGSSFTLLDDANLIQIPGIQNSGTVNVNQDSSLLYRLDYTIWTSPVTGTQTLKQFSPATTDNRFYIYDTQTDKYLSSQHTTAMNPLTQTFSLGKGYLIRMPNSNNTPGYNAGTTPIMHNGNFIGTPNNGTINIPVETTGARFNAIGNPYASPVNIYNFIDGNTASLANGTIYIWRKKNDSQETSYATVTKLAYVANDAEGGDTSGTAFNGSPSEWVLNQGQGFLVKVAPGATSVKFENRMRRGTNNGQFFRTGNTEEQNELSRLYLTLTGSQSGFGKAVVGYTATATTGVDYGWDGPYFAQDALALYTIADNTSLTIQARPEFTDTDVVTIGYKTIEAGTYTFALPSRDGLFAQGQEVYLKDNYTGIVHNFNDGAYTFATEAGVNNERFEIIYKNAPALNAADNAITNNSVIIYKQGTAMHIAAGSAVINTVTIHDIRGSVVYNTKGINATETVVNNLQVQNQVLIVTIDTDKGQVSKKVLF